MKNKPNDSEALTVINSGTCKSLTNKSTIGFSILCNSEKKVFLKLNSNSGGGFFSTEPVSLDEVLNTLKQVSDDKSLTAFYLHKLFRGRSSNSAGFLMSVLLHLQIVKNKAGKQRHYELCKTNSEIQSLITSKSERPLKKTGRKNSTTKKKVSTTHTKKKTHKKGVKK